MSKKTEKSIEAVMTSPIGMALTLRELGKLASVGCYYAVSNPEIPKEVLLYIKNSESILASAYSIIEDLIEEADEDVMDSLMNKAMNDIKNTITEDEFNNLMSKSELRKASGEVIENDMLKIIKDINKENDNEQMD